MLFMTPSTLKATVRRIPTMDCVYVSKYKGRILGRELHVLIESTGKIRINVVD